MTPKETADPDRAFVHFLKRQPFHQAKAELHQAGSLAREDDVNFEAAVH